MVPLAAGKSDSLHGRDPTPKRQSLWGHVCWSREHRSKVARVHGKVYGLGEDCVILGDIGVKCISKVSQIEYIP